MKIPIGISNRHIHLTKEDYYALFKDEPITIKRNLKQPKEFASNQTLAVEVNNKIIDNVRLVGPLRTYSQIELLKTDAEFLGINPPERDSGDLKNSETLILKGPKGILLLKECVIIANKHIHLPEDIKEKLNLNNKDIVKVRTKDNIVIDNVHIKTSPNYILEFHINKDEAIKYNLNNDDEVEIC